MMIKIFGAFLILFACGGTGFAISAAYLKEERMLRKLVYILEYMEYELQYRLTPLPDLCMMVANEEKGLLSVVFMNLAEELNDQLQPDVGMCMKTVLKNIAGTPPMTAEALNSLGQTLGRFNIHGQLRGLEGVRRDCQKKIDMLYRNKNERTRQYQTIGICAGAALIILFI